MNLPQIVKKAMIDNDITTMTELAYKARTTHFKVSGFLNGDESIKLVDLKSILDVLGLKVKFVDKGEL
ncbi:MAG: hypothetical protein Unbinned1520contig1002_33 [Prokaryotic dsDNA virus sp.]|nr:MAG: hypothetical protein Unbinned1520contig1002_33 [Prokaryotic dsDNA virus sp.]|tara:strand:- start:7247 stop:7450 length:204 start_codon:yes stop_codon:yes gene_type:complete